MRALAGRGRSGRLGEDGAASGGSGPRFFGQGRPAPQDRDPSRFDAIPHRSWAAAAQDEAAEGTRRPLRHLTGTTGTPTASCFRGRSAEPCPVPLNHRDLIGPERRPP
ncbi:hypothetical protein F8B43_3034 [Methylorubrum populi]|uniref:Uncharacterized protein n=1 Tax=Methylorubrum populi TaxID=223967 RepID=A0A833J7N8_9HYPH|nr:hypothetical protein F8B43_3034 [Methylorubrum populi]